MPNPLTRDEIARQGYTLSDAVRRQLDQMRFQGELGDGSKTEPRCFVCCEAESKKLVNKLLAAGLTNREIAESCDGINARRRQVGDVRFIEAAHVYRHRKEHFSVDEPAKAVYRSITERYAEQSNIDHINGVGTAVHPYALMHVVMTKGFEGIVNDRQLVSTGDALKAAKDLHQMTAADADQKKMADILYTLDRIISAAQHFIPAAQHEEFLAMVEGREAISAPLAALTEHVHEAAHEAVRGFAPKSMSDEEDQ
jgi:hypothetical protein